MHEGSTDVVVLHMNTSSTIASSFSFESIIRNCALIAGMLVLMMLGIYLTTGIGQDPLQFIHSTEEYTGILLRNPITKTEKESRDAVRAPQTHYENGSITSSRTQWRQR